jgi:hypothetical protein
MKNEHITIEIPETVNATELKQLFFLAEWQFNGAKITAIHGRDRSTEARYAEAPEGSLMISVISTNGARSQVMAPPNSVFTR